MKYLGTNRPLRVKDYPADQRPREKALQHGIATLSDGELLALLIGSGTRQKNAVDLGNLLLQQAGDLFSLSRRSWEDMRGIGGIGPATGVRIEAAFELARRINRGQLPERQRIRGPEDVFRFYAPVMAHLEKESLRVLLLNTRNEVIKMVEVSRGLVNSTVAHPREIFQPAIQALATGIILMHNHPSQDVTPSAADKQLTQKVAAAGELIDIPLLDHLILARDSYYSFQGEGLLSESSRLKS
jgi:DNA repair protein RadC